MAVLMPNFVLAANNKNRYINLERIVSNNPRLDLALNIKSTTVNLAKSNRIRLRIKTRDIYETNDRLSSFKLAAYENLGSQRTFISSTQLTLKRGFKRNRILSLPVGNFTSDSKEIEFDLYDTEGNLINTYITTINAINVAAQPSGSRGIDLSAANCDGSSFGDCQIDYLLQRVHFEARPTRQAATTISKTDDGFYKVSLPFPRTQFRFLGKRVRRTLGNSLTGGEGGSSTGGSFNGSFFNDPIFNGEILSTNNSSIKFNGEVSILPDSAVNGYVLTSGPNGEVSWQPPVTISLNGTTLENLSTNNGYLQDPTINGIAFFTDNSAAQFNGDLIIRAGGATAGYVLTTDANGLVSWSSAATLSGNGDDLGNHSATNNLDLANHNIYNVDTINANNFNGSFTGDGSGLTGVASAINNGTVNNLSTNNGYLQDPTINGIAFFTDNSAAQFNGDLIIRAGGATAGYVLTTDANGLVSWNSAAALSGNGDDLGNHTATDNLDLANYSLFNASRIYGETGFFETARVNGSVTVGTAVDNADLSIKVHDLNNGGIQIQAGAISTPRIAILRGNVNGNGTPINDSYRVFENRAFSGTANLDFLVFDKTDGNASDPDGGFAFTNTGNDGIAETSLVIRGNSFVGIKTEDPSTELEVNGSITADNFIGSGQGLTSINGTLMNGAIASATISSLSAPDGDPNPALSISNDGSIQIDNGSEFFQFRSIDPPDYANNKGIGYAFTSNGSSTPVYSGGLHIGGSYSNGSTGAYIPNDGEISTNRTDINIMPNGELAFTATIDGEIGIGNITNPRSILEIQNPNLDNGGITIEGAYSDITPLLRKNYVSFNGTPASDSFRMFYDDRFIGPTALDFLVFDKTDGNDNNPDGGIVFTNTGNDGIMQTSLIIRGTNGFVGVNKIHPGTELDVNGTVTAFQFVGDGSGLTNVNGSSINGALTNARISSLSAPDGDPDPALSISNDGRIYFDNGTEFANLDFNESPDYANLKGIGFAFTANGGAVPIYTGGIHLGGAYSNGAGTHIPTYGELSSKNSSIKIMPNGEVAFTATIDGEIAIGHQNPRSIVDIVNNSLDNGGIIVRNSGTLMAKKTPILRRSDVENNGTPSIDSFRMYFDTDFFNSGGSNDYLVIDKTDGNNPDPDGGIVFANTGNDGIMQTSLILQGFTGYAGINKTYPGSELDVNGTVTAFNFNGNFIGNGAGLSNISGVSKLDQPDGTRTILSINNNGFILMDNGASFVRIHSPKAVDAVRNRGFSFTAGVSPTVESQPIFTGGIHLGGGGYGAARVPDDGEISTATSEINFYPNQQRRAWMNDNGLTMNGTVSIGTSSQIASLGIHDDDIPSISLSTLGDDSSDSQAVINFITKTPNSASAMLANPGINGWLQTARGHGYTDFPNQANDMIFSYWNGSSWHDSLHLDHASHNIGINTTNPTAELHIYSENTTELVLANLGNGSTVSQAGLVLVTKAPNASLANVGNSSSNGWVIVARGQGFTDIPNQENDLIFSYWNGNDYGNNMHMDHLTGNLGIGRSPTAYKLEVEGDAGKTSGGTAWSVASDSRLKNIHGKYEYGLDEVMKLNTVRFSYKKDNALDLPAGTNEIGFIAQEVKEVIPDSVVLRDHGYYDLNIHPINVALVNAVQELKQEKDDLQKELDSLKKYLCAQDSKADFCD
jgi:hypothetical protein